MRSARCLGVYCCAEAKREVGGASSEAPHSPQNLCSGGLLAPHARHAVVNRAPHSPQNFCAGGFSCWQRGHFIPAFAERSKYQFRPLLRIVHLTIWEAADSSTSRAAYWSCTRRSSAKSSLVEVSNQARRLSGGRVP